MPDTPPSPQQPSLRDILDTLKSKLNDIHTRYYSRVIPDVMTFSDLQQLAVDEAEAAILALLTTAKLEKVTVPKIPKYKNQQLPEIDRAFQEGSYVGYNQGIDAQYAAILRRVRGEDV